MQTFQTAAVVGLIDNLSGPLKQLAQQAKAAAKGIEQVKLGDSRGIDNMAHGINRANAAAREHIALLTRIRSTMHDITRAGMLYAPFLARQGFSYEKKFDDELNRMRAFTNVDRGTADEIRRFANSEGVKWRGGALGFVEAAGSALRAGLSDTGPELRRQLIIPLAKLGQQFGDLVRTDAGSGMEQALQLAEMMRVFKDPKSGKTLSVTEYAERYGADDTVKQFKSVMGGYLRLARLLPGKESDIYEYLKYAGPTAASTKEGFQNIATLSAMLANAGITGSRAGTYVRGMISRGSVPSAVAVDALMASGFTPDQYYQFMKFDPNNISTNGFVAAIQNRFGKLTPKLQNAIKASIEKFKESPDTDISKATQDIAAAIMAIPKDQRFATKGNVQRGVFNDPAKVSAWLQKQLFLGVESFSLVSMLQMIDAAKAADIAKQGKLTENSPSIGLVRKLFGIESGTAALAILNQDIASWIKKVENALSDKGNEGKTPQQQWDEAFATRLESFGQKVDRTASNIAASFDEMFRRVEGPANGLLDTVNFLAQEFIRANNAVKAFATGAFAAATVMGIIGGIRLVGGLAAGAAGGAAAGVAGGVLGGAAVGGGAGAALGAAARGVAGFGAMRMMGWAGLAYMSYELLKDVPWGNAIGGEDRERMDRIEELRKRIADADRPGLSGMARNRVSDWRRELRALEAAGGSPWDKDAVVLAPGNAAKLGLGQMGQSGLPQSVQVSGEAELVLNNRIDVGLKPEVLDIINKARIGLNSDHRLGSSVPQGVGKASPDVPLPSPW